MTPLVCLVVGLLVGYMVGNIIGYSEGEHDEREAQADADEWEPR